MAKVSGIILKTMVANAFVRAGMIQDPNMVKKIVLTIDSHEDDVSVEVTSFVTKEGIESLTEELTTHYRLELKEG